MRISTILAFFITCAAIAQDATAPAPTKEPDMDAFTKTHAALLDRSKDVSMGHIFVPSKKKPHGEIQLLKRGRAWVLQNLAYTRYPSRYVKEMRKKESKAWPDKEAQERADSDRYLEALDKAFEVVKADYEKNPPEDKLKKLLVELIFTPTEAYAVFFKVELKAENGRMLVVKATPLSFLTLGRGYMRRGLELISQELLGYSADTAKEVFSIFPEPIKRTDTP